MKYYSLQLNCWKLKYKDSKYALLNQLRLDFTFRRLIQLKIAH